MSRKKEPVPIPVLDEATSRLNRLPEDIKLIQGKEGLGLIQIARTFGVNKSCVWNWRNGRMVPREPLTILCIISWADRLRNGKGHKWLKK